jgi:hypothetical protein
MARFQSTVVPSCLVGLALLGIVPSQVAAQIRQAGPRLSAEVVAGQAWSTPSRTWLSIVSGPVYQPRADHSGGRIIAIHAVVGTGAGLLIGLVLSGASVGDDQTSVVLTWTALGAAAGVVSGVVTWLVGRRQ